MSTEIYEIVRNGESWAVNHNGSLEGGYATKEAAFEAAAMAGSNAIKNGIGIAIAVPPREAGQTATGGRR